MARADDSSSNGALWLLASPWPCLIAGLVATVFGSMALGLGGTGIPLGILLLLLGVSLALGGAGIRLRAGGQDFEERFLTAVVIAVAAVIPFLALLALDPEWDTAIMVLWVVVGVMLAGALLWQLPRLVRRCIISLLAVVHFIGILSAVNSVAPPNAPPSWVMLQVWTRVYRPYLQFMYLNNAYHFYSPEPGPATLLWFRIEYQDGSSRWVKVPNREDFPTRLAYQRRLAMTESTNMLNWQTPPFFQEMLMQRRLEGNRFKDGPVPLYPDLHETMQYREPVPYSKKMVAAYARHVARNYPNETQPDLEVKGVKVYRVTHQIISAPDLSRGIHPLDPTLYWPYYQGEFDTDGNLKAQLDPFRYWLIPIVKEEKDPRPGARRFPGGRPDTATEYIVRNYLEVHAGDKPKQGKGKE